MRLLDKPKIVGTGLHRCGWPYVVDHIKRLDTGTGIVCDDFLEQTFTLLPHEEIPHLLQEQPWIAIAHLPPAQVKPFMLTCFKEYADGKPGSVQALANLRGICTMSNHLADRFRQVCDTPVHVIPYPTRTDVHQFDMNGYLRRPTLLHVGWFFKNLLLLEHIAPNRHIKRKIQIESPCLPGDKGKQVKQHFATHIYPERWLYGDVHYIHERLPDADYDSLLTHSVIALEFMDCAATTVVVEGLARNAPMLLGRHEALFEYVGEDYPMFFDDVGECEQLLHPANVFRTYNYLKALDKSFLQIDSFVSRFQEWVTHHETP